MSLSSLRWLGLLRKGLLGTEEQIFSAQGMDVSGWVECKNM
jgi:hypothetical protein